MKWLWLTLGASSVYMAYRLSQSPHGTPRLYKQVVVITGASSGIGRAYALAFAQRGARVVLAARRENMLAEVRDEIAPFASDVLVVPTDVSDDAQIRNLIDTVLARFGRIDILINNAGLSASGPLQTIPTDRIRRALDINLTSAIALATLALPSMLAHGSGWIINISSVAGAIAGSHFVPYGASKAGLIAFSDGLRRELDGTGVEVLCVLPGWTYSEMVSPTMAKTVLAMGLPMANAEDVAERTIEAMFLGTHTLYLGGVILRLGAFINRHLPELFSMAWRSVVTPQYIAASQQERE